MRLAFAPLLHRIYPEGKLPSCSVRLGIIDSIVGLARWRLPFVYEYIILPLLALKLESILGLPVVPFYLFLGRVPLLKQTTQKIPPPQKKKTVPYSNLSTGGPSIKTGQMLLISSRGRPFRKWTTGYHKSSRPPPGCSRPQTSLARAPGCSQPSPPRSRLEAWRWKMRCRRSKRRWRRKRSRSPRKRRATGEPLDEFPMVGDPPLGKNIYLGVGNIKVDEEKEFFSLGGFCWRPRGRLYKITD